MIRHFHRSRTATGSRRWLVLLSLLWLNLAILPCAMALETAPESDPGHDCCPPVLELAAAAECCELDPANVEKRGFEPSKDTVAIFCTVPHSLQAVFTTLQSQPSPPDPESPLPPLHLLNCVFLK